jgi:hypothetical protein
MKITVKDLQVDSEQVGKLKLNWIWDLEVRNG